MAVNPQKLRGRMLRDARVRAGMSLRDAARVVGLTDVEYGEVERGLRAMSDAQWDTLAIRIDWENVFPTGSSER